MSWLKALLGLLHSLAQWFQQRQLIFAGKGVERAKNLEQSVDVAKRQARAASDAPDTRDELVEQLRDKKRDF